MNYTVIGDRVNLASRLQSLNKVFGTEMLIDQAVALALSTEFLVRKVDRVAVFGKQEVVTVSELIGIKEGASAEQITLAKNTNEAFKAYVGREFARAAELYNAILVQHPDDQVAAVMHRRSLDFQASPPAEDWEGQTVFSVK